MVPASLEVLVVVLLVLVNGFLAMAEMALVSARTARLQHRAEAGDAGAALALQLAREPARFLSTIQVGITLVGILAGAFGGATIADNLRGQFVDAGLGTSTAGALAVGLVVAAITFATLIVGELVPKRLALLNPERVAIRVARPMQGLATIARPAVAVLSVTSGAMLWLLRAGPQERLPVTEEELRVLIDSARRAGVLESTEQEMVYAVFRLADLRVGELMTPRPMMEWIDVEEPPEEQWKRLSAWEHAWFPVCRDDPDNVVGIVGIREAWAELEAGRKPNMAEIAREVTFLPESLLAIRALDAFRTSGAPVAIVVDEHGGTQGLITPADILEAVVGAIPQPGQAEEPGVTRNDDGTWLVDGLLPVYELKEALSLRELPDEGEYQTVGGFVVYRMEHIPKAGEHFDEAGYRFRVVDMDGQRVDKVMVSQSDDSAIQGSGDLD